MDVNYKTYNVLKFRIIKSHTMTLATRVIHNIFFHCIKLSLKAEKKINHVLGE